MYSVQSSKWLASISNLIDSRIDEKSNRSIYNHSSPLFSFRILQSYLGNPSNVYQALLNLQGTVWGIVDEPKICRTTLIHTCGLKLYVYIETFARLVVSEQILFNLLAWAPNEVVIRSTEAERLPTRWFKMIFLSLCPQGAFNFVLLRRCSWGHRNQPQLTFKVPPVFLSL